MQKKLTHNENIVNKKRAKQTKSICKKWYSVEVKLINLHMIFSMLSIHKEILAMIE
jgi:hypothetical protein